MIITLPDTTTRKIAASLLEARENNSQTTGRVLTLLVVASLDDDVDHIISATSDASHEHPSRVLVLLTGETSGPSLLDAQVRVGGDAGASEMVIMEVSGELTDHLHSVVTPLLLPDTPIVTWWPSVAPDRPSDHPLGRLAQRRITSIARDGDKEALARLRSHYAPGDSDMMWSRITAWRGIVASSLDQHPHEEVLSATLTGPAADPSVDIAAGWLADRLGVEVVREFCAAEEDPGRPPLFPIRSLRFDRKSGPVTIEAIDHRTVQMSLPGRPESLVAMSVRTDADCLSEELRYLDSDVAYAQALRGLPQVTVADRPH